MGKGYLVRAGEVGLMERYCFLESAFLTSDWKAGVQGCFSHRGMACVGSPNGSYLLGFCAGGSGGGSRCRNCSGATRVEWEGGILVPEVAVVAER